MRRGEGGVGGGGVGRGEELGGLDEVGGLLWVLIVGGGHGDGNCRLCMCMCAIIEVI